jgi:hypothetical protein
MPKRKRGKIYNSLSKRVGIKMKKRHDRNSQSPILGGTRREVKDRRCQGDLSSEIRE